MLRKMYLVSSGHFHNSKKQRQTNIEPKSLPKKNITKKRWAKQTEHLYNKWLRIREKVEDAQVRRKTLINAFKDFLKQVLPDTKAKVEPKLEKLYAATQTSPPPSRPLSWRWDITNSTTSEEVIYETSTRPKLFQYLVLESKSKVMMNR
jgi:hypothetical protein